MKNKYLEKNLLNISQVQLDHEFLHSSLKTKESLHIQARVLLKTGPIRIVRVYLVKKKVK